ncbi:MAG: PfkB family carbohydrate kinase [Chloroflexota bacterium]|nr:PfkB family carbohydrate kinase [Chloroflexota bacterium]
MLVSTHAVDRVPTSQEVRELPGGPALYVASALDRLGKRCRILSGERAIVDVIPGANGEQYLVRSLPSIALPAEIVAPAIVLSPIMREIDPHRLPAMVGLVVVDLQGFVREPGKPSSICAREVDLVSLLSRADIVKATDRELAALSAGSREVLKETLLIVTRGARGATVIRGEDEIMIASRPVATSWTIGAGDNFLAALTAGLLDQLDPVVAAERAARFVEAFLRERDRERDSS